MIVASEEQDGFKMECLINCVICYWNCLYSFGFYTHLNLLCMSVISSHFNMYFVSLLELQIRLQNVTSKNNPNAVPKSNALLVEFLEAGALCAFVKGMFTAELLCAAAVLPPFPVAAFL